MENPTPSSSQEEVPEKQSVHLDTRSFSLEDPPKLTLKGIHIIGIFVALLVVVVILGLIPRLIHWQNLKERAEKINPLVVKVLEVKQNKKPIELVLPGTTQAIRFTPIWARVDGYIKDFYVDIGDHVVTDQLIAEIETPEIDHQLDQAKADLASTMTRLELAKLTSERWEAISTDYSEAISPQEVDEKKSAFLAEAAAFTASEANVKRLEEIQSFGKLFAPFPGIITQRNIEIGTLVTAGSQGNLQQLFTLAKTDVIRIFVNVPQPYYRSINVKGIVEISVSEFPDTIFHGIIARTADALDPASRTLLTEIHVDNRDGKLITGLYATAKFMLIPEVANYIIPTTALIIREARPHVGIVDANGIVHLREVGLGRNYGKTVEITSGLQENDKVITNPNEKIKEGVRVNYS